MHSDCIASDIVAASSVAIIACDLDGRVSFWSPAAERLWSRPAPEVLSRDLAGLGLCGGDVLAQLVVEVRQSGRRVEVDVPRPFGDGSTVLTFAAFPVINQRGVLYAVGCVARDVTERVLAVDRLRQASRVLERQVQERAAEIARVGLQLEAALHNRDAFISMASHELRTPLHALALQLATLRRLGQRGGEVISPSVARRLDAMQRQVTRLSSLVDRLLDVTHIAAGRLRLERENVNLSKLTVEVVERFSDEAEASGCSFALSIEQDLCGWWDRTRLEQILTNLISNAIKYGAGKQVSVAVRREREHVTLSVQDSGIGISRAELGRLFGRFERLVSDRHFGGFGLGLWIVRQITEALGGRIHVESDIGRGAEFTVTLPVVLQPAMSDASAAAQVGA